MIPAVTESGPAVHFNFKTTDPKGMSLDEFEESLATVASLSKDYVAPADKLEVVYEDDDYKLNVDGIGQFGLMELFHKQMATRSHVGQKFHDRARRYPEVYTPLLNTFIHQEWGGEAMVRTVGDHARALLSSSYRRIDNITLAPTVVKALREVGEFQLKSVSLTETKMFIKAVFPQTQLDVKVGDTVESGIITSNSEVGMGSVSVQQFIHRLVCLNGMVVNDAGAKRRHVGRNMLEGESASELFTSETLQAEDKALMLKVRDIVKATSNEERFEQTVEAMRNATEDKISGHPEKAVEVLAKQFQLNEFEQGGVLRHLIEGGDVSRFGLLNAVTRTAQDSETYDRAVDLEVLGGRILDLSPKEWKGISEAA